MCMRSRQGQRRERVRPVSGQWSKSAPRNLVDLPIYDKTFHAMELEKGQSVEALLSGKVESQIQMHERRLQTLVKAGLARPYMRDAQDKPYSWVLADDFEKKVLAFDNESGWRPS